MTVTDAALLKEKFDDLMLAVESFGTGSKQLSDASGDLQALAGEIQNANQRLAETAQRCQDYLETADLLINEGFSQQIRKDLEEASGLIGQCRRQCEDLSVQYREILSTFAADADKLDAQQTTVVHAIQEAAADITRKIDAASRSLEQHISVLQTSLPEKVAQLVTEQQEERSGKLLEAAKAELQKHTVNTQESLSAETARLSGKLLAVGGSLDQLDQNVGRAFLEKTKYLEERQQEYTLELLEALQNLDQKTKQLRRQQRLTLIGMIILAVLIALGRFI